MHNVFVRDIEILIDLMKSNRKSKEANVKFSDIEEERDTLKALVAQQKRQIEELEKERNALQAVVSHDEQHLKEHAPKAAPWATSKPLGASGQN